MRPLSVSVDRSIRTAPSKAPELSLSFDEGTRRVGLAISVLLDPKVSASVVSKLDYGVNGYESTLEELRKSGRREDPDGPYWPETTRPGEPVTLELNAARP